MSGENLNSLKLERIIRHSYIAIFVHASILFLAIGCLLAFGVTANVNHPVLPGPVERIGGPHVSHPPNVDGQYFRGPSGTTTEFGSYGSSIGKLNSIQWDEAILGSLNPCENCKVKVQSIGASSHLMNLLMFIEQKNRCYIEGYVYHLNKNSQRRHRFRIER